MNLTIQEYKFVNSIVNASREFLFDYPYINIDNIFYKYQDYLYTDKKISLTYEEYEYVKFLQECFTIVTSIELENALLTILKIKLEEELYMMQQTFYSV